jgi:alkanesulfonate monooxygenase SsuD/methylene tetrahydromethanopterin reductase-like flavin-dependent oxidoreductase (luciferase family)
MAGMVLIRKTSQVHVLVAPPSSKVRHYQVGAARTIWRPADCGRVLAVTKGRQIGVGGSPQSVIRAARYGFSLMLAIIGGSPARFAPFSRLFHEALETLGHAALPVGVHSPGHVALTDEKAREEFWPRYLEVIRHVSKTRGFAVPTKESFLYEIGPHGALYVGSPETVAQKIAVTLTALGATRFDLKYGMGGLSHETLMTNIELYGTQVAPRVRELLA